MELSPGCLLINDLSMADPFFQNVIIFIAEHNEKGTLGFIVNKIFPRTLRDLEEFSTAKSFPLFTGGPVCTDQVYFIHRRADLIIGGTAITPDIFLGGDFPQALAGINNGSLEETDIRLFLGYCGWDSNELEEEIKEGSWIISDSSFHF